MRHKLTRGTGRLGYLVLPSTAIGFDPTHCSEKAADLIVDNCVCLIFLYHGKYEVADSDFIVRFIRGLNWTFQNWLPLGKIINERTIE